MCGDRSDTPPVREVLNNKNGVLVPFFDIEQLAERVIEALSEPRQFRSIRTQARRTVVDHYDLARICLPKMMTFIKQMSKSKEPFLVNHSITVAIVLIAVQILHVIGQVALGIDWPLVKAPAPIS